MTQRGEAATEFNSLSSIGWRRGPERGGTFVFRPPLPMNHTPKAALKTHALQTLRAGEGRQKLASAFGVRASLAPLFLRRSLKMRFKGLMREHLREILSSVLSPLLRRGERKKTRSETSSQPANDFDYCSAEDAEVLAPWNNHVPTHPSLRSFYSTGRAKAAKQIRLREIGRASCRERV